MMPTKPPTHKPAGRPATTRKHQPDTRQSASKRGYDRKWQRVRAIKLSSDPLCERCERHGIVEPATEVHHRIALADGGERLDTANLESLCKRCHSAHTMREAAMRRRENVTAREVAER